MKVIDLALKDLLRATRNLFLVGMAVAAPLLICALMYLSFGRLLQGDAGVEPVTVGIVNADVLPADAALEESLGSTIRDLFHDESTSSWLVPADYADVAQAQAALDGQSIGVAVIIPPEFTADFVAGATPDPITILQDPTLTVGPSAVRDLVSAFLDGVSGGEVAYGVLSAHSAEGAWPVLVERYYAWYRGFQQDLLQGAPGAALKVVQPGGEPAAGATAASVIMPLVMVGQIIFFAFYTGAFSMMSLLQESEEGTLARLFTTPTRRGEILAGKFLAVCMTVLLQGLVLIAAGTLLFQARWGQPGSVALALLGQVFAATGLGVLLISLVKTTRQAGAILGGALTALGMMSGLFTSSMTMPAGFDALARFTPQGRVLAAWRLAIEGSPPAELLVPVLILVVVGSAFFALGAVTFRRRYA